MLADHSMLGDSLLTNNTDENVEVLCTILLCAPVRFQSIKTKSPERKDDTNGNTCHLRILLKVQEYKAVSKQLTDEGGGEYSMLGVRSKSVDG